MSTFVRVWKELDLVDVEKHLLVMGELTAECFACHHIGLKADTVQCPECGAAFKYMGFRRSRVDAKYLAKLKEELPYLTFIDFEDFKKGIGKSSARKLLDL